MTNTEINLFANEAFFFQAFPDGRRLSNSKFHRLFGLFRRNIEQSRVEKRDVGALGMCANIVRGVAKLSHLKEH